MQSYIIVVIIAIVVLFGARSLWDRFKNDSDYGIEPWMLHTPGLDGICRDYLDHITEMKSGKHDREVIHYLDSQRQVTHDQILGYLELDRSSSLDVEEFAKRYLGLK